MHRHLLNELTAFAADTRYEDLPERVVEETIRIILDSIGCGLAGVTHRRGRIGVDHGRAQGGDAATILGTGERASVMGAAFANAELINALDHDAVLPPGHVCPYVLPGALATAEALRLTGKDLILATAIAHEMSNRIGKAMDYLRDIIDGQVSPPPVWGFASTIFGATAAVARLRGVSPDQMRNALSIAAIISPVNSAAAWRQHAPATTIKYMLGGWLAQGALTAAQMAELGHRGDDDIFDPEFGYPRFIGTRRWQPENTLRGLGTDWIFPRESSFKPYPHCRVLHAPLDALTEIVTAQNLRPDEIEEITVWVEGFVERPIWMNNAITDVTDAQFSIAHGMALGAHRFASGPDWQRPENVHAPSVMALMERVRHVVHPDYVKSLLADGGSRPSRVEVRARGQVFAAERSHPKGTGAPGSATFFTTPELVDKFLSNAGHAMAADRAQALAEALLNLPEVADTADLMRRTGPQ